MQVVSFLDAIRGKLTATFAVSAGIRQQHGISMFQEQFGIAANTFAVVCDAVHQDNGVPVENFRAHIPALKHDGIGASNADVLKLSLKLLTNKIGSFLLVGKRPVRQPQTAFRQQNPGDNR